MYISLETITFFTAFCIIALIGLALIFFNYKAYKREKQRQIDIKRFLNTKRNAFRN
jgi:hypothetical protein